jgi:hypothetical protein
VNDLRPLWELLARDQGLLARSLVDAPPAAEAALGALAASGPRVQSEQDEYALLVECILEGYLLHYAGGRVVAPADPDLSLLCGDYLYALGLDRLARLGDVDAVAELADLISLCAQAHVCDPRPWQLTGALWVLAVLAVTSGAWDGHADAKRLVREGAPAAAAYAGTAARSRARALGIESNCDRALIAFRDAVGDLASTT